MATFAARRRCTCAKAISTRHESNQICGGDLSRKYYADAVEATDDFTPGICRVPAYFSYSDATLRECRIANRLCRITTLKYNTADVMPRALVAP